MNYANELTSICILSLSLSIYLSLSLCLSTSLFFPSPFHFSLSVCLTHSLSLSIFFSFIAYNEKSRKELLMRNKKRSKQKYAYYPCSESSTLVLLKRNIVTGLNSLQADLYSIYYFTLSVPSTAVASYRRILSP